jgi:hypothetical protein
MTLATTPPIRKRKAALPRIPPRAQYFTASGVGNLAWLPFVHRPKRGNKSATMWRVTPTEDYRLAYTIGTEYAAHFVHFLRDNPARPGGGVLRKILADADLNDSSPTGGYVDGFIHYLELLLYHQARQMDLYAYADQCHERIDRIYQDDAACGEESQND